MCFSFGWCWALNEPQSPQQKFMEAISAGNVKAVENLIKLGVDIHEIDKTGLDPLGLGARKGFVEIGQLLLSKGARVNGLAGGYSPIMRASFSGHLAFVELLLDNGADPDLEAANGFAAFDWALEGKHSGVMARLYEVALLKLEPEARTWVAALKNGDVQELEKALKQHFPLLPATHSIALNLAVLARNPSALAVLLKAGLNPNTHNQSGYAPLPLACRMAEMDLVINLLDHGANPNIGNDGNDEASPLLQAGRGGHDGIGKLLLAKEADVNKRNARGYSALILASLYGHPEFVEMLLANGADTTAREQSGYSALDFALERQRDLVVKALVAHWAKQAATTPTQMDLVTQTLAEQRVALANALKKTNLELPSAFGISLLNLAVVLGEGALVRAICEAGVSADQDAPGGYGPVAFAAYFGREDLMALLKTHGAALDSKSNSRYQTTPLMETTRKGHLDSAKWLLSQGVNVNESDRHGDHALNWAAANGHLPLVKLLVEAGADLSRTGQEPLNALQIAQRMGNQEMVTYLENATTGKLPR